MILVTGATGNVGSVVVDLLSRRRVPVRALTRDPAAARLPHGVEAVRGSTSDPVSIRSALAEVDAVFLNLVGDPRPCLEALADVTPSTVVLLSSLTAGTRAELSYASQFADVESAVREVAPQVSVLRPGQFASNVSWWRPMLDSGTVYAPFLDVALPTIAPEDIGAVAVEALQSGAHTGRTLVLSGPELVSPRAQIRALAGVTGRELTAVEVSEDQFRSNAGFSPETVEYLAQVMGHPRADELTISPTVEAVTGRCPLRFEEWVRLHREEFV